jgi:hypothetical protein
MCYALFIGTDQKQTPEPLFIEGETMLFLTEELKEEPKKVDLLDLFSKKYIYHVGSWMGCSCGFRYESSGGLDDEEKQKNDDSMRKLLDLVQNLAENEEYVQFFCCWEGDWVMPILGRRTIFLSEMLASSDDFLLKERVFLNFEK